MKRPPLWRLSVATNPEAEDAVAELLTTLLGAPASSYFDLECQTSVVSVYLPQAARPPLRRQLTRALERLAACGLNLGARIVKSRRIRHEDWAESWKRHFKPLEIGKSLLIKPSWSQRPGKKNQEVVILDPGLSFGTGQHATTSFCLAEVARHVDFSSPRSFLDIGTGSGILAIAAAKLKYRPVVAFDFDPESLRVARANALTNHVSRIIQLARDDVRQLPLRPARCFDLVCANLISTLLIAERKRIISQVNQGGTLVLAGILKTEFPDVQRIYEERGLVLTRSVAQNEWQSGAFCLPKKV